MCVINKDTAIISNIQRCSVHDGPGIRTTIFFKGCNMDCAWCHNPETITFKPEYLLYPEKCIKCEMCEDGCFSGAKVLCGQYMTVADIVSEASLDRPYYGNDGGITISGGEPTCQYDFLLNLLQAFKKQGIHTAIETNLNCSREILKLICEYCDLIMFDIKLFDDDMHTKYTGCSNKNILNSVEYIASLQIPTIVRTPIMSGINDSSEEISNITSYISKYKNILYYELLPYHSLGLSKESGSNKHIKFSAPTKEKLQQLAVVAKKNINTVYIAGVKA